MQVAYKIKIMQYYSYHVKFAVIREQYNHLLILSIKTNLGKANSHKAKIMPRTP